MRIELITEVRASRDRCFDLSRDLDLHQRSMAQTSERIVGGRRSGLIELDEEVEWEGRHFGFRLRHRARITAFDRPSHFRDVMVRGRFRVFEHDHFFETIDGGTRMRESLEFASPFGPIGRLVDRLILLPYLTRLLERRNQVIKAAAEAE